MRNARYALGPMGAAKKLTVEQWYALDDDESSDELVDGVLEEAEVPDRVHEIVITWLVLNLGPWIHARAGFIFPGGLRLAIRKDRGRIPDAVCYLRGRRPEPGLVRTPPDIMIEVVSPRPRDARRDRVEKIGDYAHMGAKQYWIVDPKLRTFEVWKLDKTGRYVRTVAASRGKVRVGPTLDLDTLWAEVDRLERKR
jgi:Uma2 family endonuclease